ncbi:MAG: UDP-2,3-diacylglucosamine diphosphatase [Bacteroidales bacterium]|nr:UDP-2,3-diacylglucosamine diphosphatase [Bacteroidales bacterium]
MDKSTHSYQAPLTKKIYFASDFHLGVPNHEKSLRREKILVHWLDEVKDSAQSIYLMGDVFDFWFEYKTVIPKGFVRLLGKLAELVDRGIAVHLFRGNHDIWAFDYLQTEVGIQLHDGKMLTRFGNKLFFLAHGDGLGPGDKGYKFVKKIFRSRFNQWFFRWLHPDFGTRLALYFSRKSRYANNENEAKYGNPPIEEEMLYKYAARKISHQPEIDYFIFGHRHLPTNVLINDKARLVILGDWITHFTYAVFDGDTLELKKYDPAPDLL